MTNEELIALYSQRDKQYLNQLQAMEDKLLNTTELLRGTLTGGFTYLEPRIVQGKFAYTVVGEYELRNARLTISDSDAYNDGFQKAARGTSDSNQIYSHA